jgi:hypothetical protein
MKDRVTLSVMSSIALLLFTLHWSDEISRGLERGTLASAWGVVILVVWLFAIVGLADGRARYIILLLASVLGVVVLLLHMGGAGLVGGKVGASGTGVFFWVWTNIALGTISAVSAILSARGLWTLRRGNTG